MQQQDDLWKLAQKLIKMSWNQLPLTINLYIRRMIIVEFY